LDLVGPEDKVAIWTYGDTVQQLADFSQGHETLSSLLFGLKAPPVSETNLYDALIFALNRMRPVTGRKAIILISSGVDTFSKAKFEDVLSAARQSNTPVYAIYLGSVLREAAQLHGAAGLLNRIDWKAAENRLLEIARVSGGRMYSPESTVDLSATYDDLMENLRVRYVIRYKSSHGSNSSARRTVTVQLVNPKTGRPLEIVDANGKAIHAHAIAQLTYSPSATSELPGQ
jgi:Ca-activated chloride channel family protein